MSDTSPVLSLPLIRPAQAQKHVTHNEALLLLDAVVQLAVEDRDRSVPPALPEPGQRHIVAPGGSGDWAGQDGMLALHDGSTWRFFAPRAGWRAEVLAENMAVIHDGTAWVEEQLDLDNLEGLGIGTASDDTNRLSVSAAATLFSHAGAGHQLKLNKAAPADTASLLFQTGWSGRAEMGLNGSDGWSLKVSADGSAWTEALAIDPNTGAASGAAVQSTAHDAREGRLMRADFGYSPGNVLGPVSQSSGLPTGAVIERGSGTDGEHVRFADGTQFCSHVLTLGLGAGNDVSGTWEFPAAFAAAPVLSFSCPEAEADYVNCSAAQFGIGRQGDGAVSATLTLTGIAALNAGAEVRNVRVLAMGRWF